MRKNRSEEAQLVAVISGDLIDSTGAQIDQIEASFAILTAIADQIQDWCGGDQPTLLTQSRGDGWQLVVPSYQYAMRAALTIIAALKGDPNACQTRLAIGIGEVQIRGKDLSDASGSALVASGRSLDSRAKTRSFSISGKINGYDLAIAELLAAFVHRWTPNQSQAMALWLQPDNPTLETVGTKLGISPQAVSYRIRPAGGSSIRRALKFWEDEKEPRS